MTIQHSDAEAGADVGFALSPQQHAVLSADRIPVARCAVRILGELDRVALRAALNQVVDRHEVLRTVYRRPTGLRGHLQHVLADAVYSWSEQDLRTSSRPLGLNGVVHERSGGDLNLGNGPVLDVCLVRVADDEHVLLVVLPAAGTDAIGLDNIVADLAACYEAERTGDEPPEVVLQYADLAAVFEDLLQSPEAGPGREHWRRVIGSAEAGWDRAVAAGSPGRVSVPLAESTPTALGVVGEQHGVELPDLFLAAWSAYLARTTGARDQVVGVVSDGRTFEELADAVGLCARTVPVACGVTASEPFGELVTRVAEGMAVARDWQDCCVPVFGAARISYEFRTLRDVHAAAGVTFRIEDLELDVAGAALGLVVTRHGDKVVAELRYDGQRCGELEATRHAADVAALLDALPFMTNAPVGALPVIDPAEREKVLAASASVAPVRVEPVAVHQLFEQRVELAPDRVAVVAGGDHLTYAALNANANRLARALRRAGVRTETPVAVPAGRALDTIVALLAVSKAGGCAVPIDTRYPKERITYLLRDSGARFGVGGPEWSDRWQVACVDPATCRAEADGDLDLGVRPDNLFSVLYTSGTTGQPKGVLVPHRGIVNRLLAGTQWYPLDSGDRVFHTASFSFDFSLWELFAPIAAGATVVLAESAEQEAAGLLVQGVRREAATAVHGVPSMLRLVAEEAELHECTSLRRVFAGGEALSAELAGRLGDITSARVFNQYGPTETSVDVTVWPFEPHRLNARWAPIGTPFANAQTYVLDMALHPVPTGVTGELYVGGECVTRGYLGRSGATAERFIADPFGSPGGRLYRTGDLCRLSPDGLLEFVGRADLQLKIRGFRVEPGEIENVLGEHPDVIEAAVDVHEMPASTPKLVAYVVSRSAVVVAGLRDFLSERLPVHLVPGAFVPMRALPRTPSGKLDRKALPPPGTERPELSAEYVAPRTPTERDLAGIWGELLGVELVGRDDDFLALGGHSLLATQLVSRIKQRFDVNVSLVAFFENPTIAALAALVERPGPKPAARRPLTRSTDRGLLVPIVPGGSGAPVYLVHPVSGGVACYVDLANHLGHDRPVYALRARGLDEGSNPDRDISVMAARYLDAIRLVQPSNTPHVLAGWSFGGLVAFEMARRLTAAGEKVGVLALIDTPAPDEDTDELDEVAVLLSFAGDYAELRQRELKLSRAELTEVDPYRRPSHLLGVMQDQGLLTSPSQAAQAERQLEVFQANLDAWRSYEPQPYEGSLQLYNAKDGSSGTGRAAWQRIVNGTVDAQLLDGDHYTLVREPLVRELAKHLSSEIIAVG
ncbi:amino acid adenylation domain-containing protein [Lentzea sp. NPDC034063]|uniref:non-ribosomal peptide synthetase n=1 Tax=unclassified Lentzea TaxID=2643253 RepID=UPI003406B472